MNRPPVRLRGGVLLGVWLLVAAAMCSGAAGPPPGWTDCIPQGTLTLRAETGDRWASTALCDLGRAAFEADLELRWSRRGRSAGGFELAIGPHGVGSSGYRLVLARRPWRTVECRGPRLAPRKWHSVKLRIRPGAFEYWLDGGLVARCPVEAADTGTMRLRVAPGAEVAARRCWVRAAGAGTALGTSDSARFVYEAESFDTSGWPTDDETAEGGRAVTVVGQGRRKWLVRGQDGSLPRSGRYVAHFGLRGVDGAGRLWLEVARSAGGVIAAETLLLEELPRDGYARVPVAFHARAGELVEYRVAADSGRLQVDKVVVSDAAEHPPGEGAAASGERAVRRARQALPLADVWDKARKAGGSKLAAASLQRRLGRGGWYEFRATWQQQRAERLDGLAADLWVACRDTWGRVRVLDYAVAYDGTARGGHTAAGWLGPASVRRYGSPVALFAVLYWRGQPVAAAWRKWGIPVDDKWIVGAQVVGRLRETAPTE